MFGKMATHSVTHTRASRGGIACDHPGPSDTGMFGQTFCFFSAVTSEVGFVDSKKTDCHTITTADC